MDSKFSIGDKVFYKPKNGNKIPGVVIKVFYHKSRYKCIDSNRDIYTVSIESPFYKTYEVDAYDTELILMPTKQSYEGN